ncbi:MAG: hypothetical protein Q4G52_01660 [Clostridia bacterium]|nr:hypothetical protein [Clostridia bacterium]
MRQEVWEAAQAGERALHSLYEVENKLESAGSWGMLDMLGGGFVSSMIKRSKLGDAQALMNDAQQNLKAFERELKDITIDLELDVDIDDFLSFADVFMDNFFADYLVQRKIDKAKKQTQDAIRLVESLLDALRRAQ